MYIFGLLYSIQASASCVVSKTAAEASVGEQLGYCVSKIAQLNTIWGSVRLRPDSNISGFGCSLDHEGIDVPLDNEQQKAQFSMLLAALHAQKTMVVTVNKRNTNEDCKVGYIRANAS